MTLGKTYCGLKGLGSVCRADLSGEGEQGFESCETEALEIVRGEADVVTKMYRDAETVTHLSLLK